MINYCGTCFKKTHVKPCLIDESMEDYLCAKCRKLLATELSVEVLKER